MSSVSLPIALVTGASRGIGAAIAESLAESGYFVVINYQSNEAKAQAVLDGIRAKGGSGALCRFDIADSDAISAAFDKILADHGPVRVLVNNAGISIDGLLLRLKPEDLDRTLSVDLKGAIYCSQAAAKQMMRAKQGGSIVQISSVIGEMGNAGQAAYSAAKAGLIGFSKSIAKELGSRSIRCNVVTPGFITTDMTETMPQAQKDALLQSIPLGCLGTPQDVAAVVRFLASDGGRYITGQVIGVNGGLYI